MSKRKKRVDADDIAEGGDLLLGLVVAVFLAVPISGGVYALVSQVNATVGLVLAVVVFFPGLILGFIAYKFRWFLRSLFD